MSMNLKFIKALLKIDSYLIDGAGTDYVIFDTNWVVDLGSGENSNKK